MIVYIGQIVLKLNEIYLHIQQKIIFSLSEVRYLFSPEIISALSPVCDDIIINLDLSVDWPNQLNNTDSHLVAGGLKKLSIKR